MKHSAAEDAGRRIAAAARRGGRSVYKDLVHRRWPFVLAIPMLACCKRCDEASETVHDAALDAVTAAASSVVIAEPPAIPDAALDAGAALETDAAFAGFQDAGVSDCRLVYGPAEQPFRGPAAMAVAGSTLRLVANDVGKPRIYPVAIPPLPPKGSVSFVPPRPASFTAMRWPPCEIAGRFAYCQGPGGPVVRSTLPTGEADVVSSEHKTIAKSRSGTRIAAASLAGGHTVVAYLDSRHTSEGDMLQAFAALDDREPVRLSEEGAGATAIGFVPRGDHAVFVYLDTRTSMVPIHARPVSSKESELALGPDVVMFVGGAPERGIDFALASVGAKAFALVPMPRETIDFGMAAVPVDEPPKDDVSAVWSLYPNGIDPAPIAAAPRRDGAGAWVARVRPRERAVGSHRIVELGSVDGSGAFTSYGEIAPGRGVTDLGLVEDRNGAVWVLYGDSRVTWLERRVCPPTSSSSRHD